MQRYANQRQEQLKATRINGPDYGKRDFVYRLVEAWIFLTGEKPGMGSNATNNPFLRFVEAAARDAGIEDENFFRALESALEKLNRYHVEVGQSCQSIAARGPAWV
jgi:hypothetical protein